jgi:hypothetical protein
VLLGAPFTRRLDKCTNCVPGINVTTLSGLRMSATIARNDFGFNELEVTIENATSREILIVLGRLPFRFADAIHVLVKPPNGPEVAAFYLDSGDGVAPGRTFPMVIPLLPKSQYSVGTLLAAWGYYGPSVRRVENLIAQESSLRVEFRNSDDERIKYGIGAVDCSGSRPFWNGMLSSNVLKFPLAAPPKSTSTAARGPVVRDLCLSATLVWDKTNLAELDISVHNTGLREYILAIGKWRFKYPTAIRLYIQAPNKASASEVRWSVGRIGAQVPSAPLILPLLPRSAYRVRTPLNSLRTDTRDGQLREEPLLQVSLLHAELLSQQKAYENLNANCYPVWAPPPPSSRRTAGCTMCWTGKLISNKLYLPFPIHP